MIDDHRIQIETDSGKQSPWGSRKGAGPAVLSRLARTAPRNAALWTVPGALELPEQRLGQLWNPGESPMVYLSLPHFILGTSVACHGMSWLQPVL